MSSVANLIQSSDRIAVISHIHPDGDAVGATVALTHCLSGLGKNCVGVLTEGVPPVFSFVAKSTDILHELPADLDLCIVLDAPDTHRTGQDARIVALGEAGKLAVIDHHPKGNLVTLSTASIHNVNASSTSEIIYGLIVELGGRITPDIATALLTGIFTDTGGFQHPNTTNRTLDIAAELMRRGGKLNLIVREVFHTKSLTALRLLGIALKRLRLVQHNQCVISMLTHKEITEAGATENDLLGIVSSITDLPDIQLSILLTESSPGIVRGTLRSGDRHHFDVNRLAKLLGGGGHVRAAGFTLPASLKIQGETWSIVAPGAKNS